MDWADDWGAGLDRAMTNGSWRDLDALLTHAESDADGLVAARAWYRSDRTSWEKKVRGGFWPRHREANLGVCFALLAIVLAPTPEQAARWGHLPTLWWQGHDEAHEVLVRHLVTHGGGWVQSYVAAAADVERKPDTGWAIGSSHSLLLPVITHFALPAPTTASYTLAWAHHYASVAASARWAISEHGRGHDVITDVLVDPLGRARLRRRHIASTDLAAELRADPTTPTLLPLLLSTPGALAPMENAAHPGWRLGPAVAALCSEGLLDRDQLVDAALGTLTRAESPAAQKGIGMLLTDLGLTEDDLRDRVALVQGLMATARGPATAALLGPLIAALDSGDDLAELAATVFSRKEKAQQTVLMRALLAKGATGRWGRDGVVAALRIAATVPDEKIAGRARARLDALGVAPEAVAAAAVTGLWAASPAPYTPVAVEEIPAAEPDVVAASSAYREQSALVDDALLLDAVVRWAARDPAAARRFVAQVDARIPYERPRAIMALGYARYSGARLELRRRIRHLQEVHDGQPRARSYEEPILQAIVGIQQTETGLRLGRVPLLLSTPTRSDGAVSFDALVDRLRRHAGTPVGTFDLFLALLRVGPIPPERVDELDVLDGSALRLEAPVPPRDTLLQRLRGRGHPRDAVELVRRWVRGGGLPTLRAGREADGTLTVDPIRLPVELGAFPGVPEGILAGHASDRGHWLSWASAAAQVAAAPWWPELLAAQSLRLFDQSSRAVAGWLLPPLVTSPGWAGPAVHRTVVATLSHADEDERLIGVDAFLTLADRDDFDSGLITSACLDLLARGELRLARSANAWEQVVLAGAMRALWPSVVAVLEAASLMAKKPVGLAELVAFYGRYAAAEPGAVAPSCLVALARSRGGSKAQLEARRAVEQLAGATR